MFGIRRYATKRVRGRGKGEVYHDDVCKTDAVTTVPLRDQALSEREVDVSIYKGPLTC
jgi:hypothetical protein